MAKNRTIPVRIARIFRFIYLKLFRINDSPLKIALGFGLGVFIGVMPGVGPVIALLLAIALRVNRASALLGSILFNTWVGFLSLIFSMKVGSLITGANYQDVHAGWDALMKDFSWTNLWQVSVFKVLIPMAVGYFVISISIASLMTVIVYIVAKRMKGKTGQKK